MWVSLASVQPPVQLAGSNSARTVRRLLALADVAAVESDHYLVGSAAKEILSAAVDDLEFSSDSGRESARMVSPQLLSLLLLAWSELPVDHPGQRLVATQWRSSVHHHGGVRWSSRAHWSLHGNPGGFITYM